MRLPVPDENQPASPERILRAIKAAISGRADPGEALAEVSVLGVDEQGLTVLRVELEGNLYEVKVPDLKSLVSMMGPSQRPPRATPLPVPYVTKTLGDLPGSLTPVAKGELKRLVRTGPMAQETRPIERFSAGGLQAAGFTSRGPTGDKQGIEYKPINEDGVLIIARHSATGEGALLVGAFDMAGGEGHVEDQSGAASHAAAVAVDALADRLFDAKDAEALLREAVRNAGVGVKALGVGAVCTIALALIRKDRAADGQEQLMAHVAVCGDSRVILVGADGVLKQKTVLHNLGSMVAAGLIETAPRASAIRYASVLSRGLGGNDEEADVLEWRLSSGDWLLLETDGVGDAREFEQTEEGVWHSEKCAEDQCAVLKHEQDAVGGTRQLIGYALDQMASGYGKPDNLGLVVVKIP